MPSAWMVCSRVLTTLTTAQSRSLTLRHSTWLLPASRASIAMDCRGSLTGLSSLPPSLPLYKLPVCPCLPQSVPACSLGHRSQTEPSLGPLWSSPWGPPLALCPGGG